MTREIARDLAADLSEYMKKHIPAHLMGEYACYNSCIASNNFFYNVVEECIDRKILNAPKKTPGTGRGIDGSATVNYLKAFGR